MNHAGGRAFRGTELLLLLSASAVALVAPAPLPLREAGRIGVWDLAPTIVLIGAFVVLHFVLVVRGRGEDEVIAPLVLFLTGLSLALSRHLAPDLADRQLAWTILAVCTMAVVAVAPFDPRLLRRYRYTWAIAGIALVGLTLVAGRPGPLGGPRLWLSAGGLSFQPSEALKLLLVVFLAAYLSERRELIAERHLRIGPLSAPPIAYLAPLGVVFGASLALLAVQGDLGAALLLFAIALAMLYLASGRAGTAALGMVAFALAAIVLHRFIPIVQLRTALWLDPWSDPQGLGYQSIQALMTVGAGGVIGTGLGAGLGAASLPAVHTDFVFAAVAEELGLAGASAVLAAYALLALRGLRIALSASTPFAGLLAAGLTTALAIQTAIIVGGTLRLIPLTGITLPFLSHGGSSMLVSAVSAGLLLRISTGESM